MSHIIEDGKQDSLENILPKWRREFAASFIQQIKQNLKGTVSNLWSRVRREVRKTSQHREPIMLSHISCVLCISINRFEGTAWYKALDMKGKSIAVRILPFVHTKSTYKISEIISRLICRKTKRFGNKQLYETKHFFHMKNEAATEVFRCIFLFIAIFFLFYFPPLFRIGFMISLIKLWEKEGGGYVI